MENQNQNQKTIKDLAEVNKLREAIMEKMGNDINEIKVNWSKYDIKEDNNVIILELLDYLITKHNRHLRLIEMIEELPV